MGQYYNIVLKAKGENKYHVFDRTYGGEYTMAKLMEHSYYNNSMVNAICEKLYRHPSHIAWIGDYANEEGDNLTLYKKAWRSNNYETLEKSFFNLNNMLLVNHTKKLIIDCWEYLKLNIRQKTEDWCDGWVIHPLPLLTALGNGRGGGDYHGLNKDLVGTWAWDVIEVTDDYVGVDCLIKNKNYTLTTPLFKEGA